MVRTGANGRRSEMFALAAGRGGFDRVSHRIGRVSGRVEVRGHLDGLGDCDAGTVCGHFDKLNDRRGTSMGLANAAAGLR